MNYGYEAPKLAGGGSFLDWVRSTSLGPNCSTPRNLHRIQKIAELWPLQNFAHQ
jgi:hypothetical protein